MYTMLLYKTPPFILEEPTANVNDSSSLYPHQTLRPIHIIPTQPKMRSNIYGANSSSPGLPTILLILLPLLATSQLPLSPAGSP